MCDGEGRGDTTIIEYELSGNLNGVMLNQCSKSSDNYNVHPRIFSRRSGRAPLSPLNRLVGRLVGS